MNHSRRWIVAGLGLLALAALLAYSIHTDPRWQAFDTATFLDSLVSVDKVWMAWALLAIYTTYLVRALRWKVLMARQKPHARIWNLFSATVIGFAAIGIFGRAGEIVRPYLVARKEGLPLSSQVGVWVLERAFDMLTVLVTVAFALAHFEAAGLRSSPSLSRLLRMSGNLVAFSMLSIVVIMVGLRNFAEPVTRWLARRLRFLPPRRLESVERHIQSFVEGSRAVRSWAALALCTLYSMAEWALVAFCYNAVFNSFSGGLRLGVSETLIFMGSVMAGSMVQIPGVGGGIQVASLLVLTEVFGVRPEVAAGISLLIWIFTFLAVVPPALLLAFYEGLSWGKLRRLESEKLT